MATGNLLNETLRWNHVIEPGYTNPGASVDKAFKNNWGALSQAVGMNVEDACKQTCRDTAERLRDEKQNANHTAAKILANNISEINKDTIP